MDYPVRINRYLALQKICTRREADELVAAGRVSINGKRAALGSKVREGDQVDVRHAPKAFRYFAYNKPRGVITHSAQGEEKEISNIIGIKGVHPVGRLDKDSYGLIILTDDGRLTEALLSPEHGHEKEYEVLTARALPRDFKRQMERGVNIGGPSRAGYRTKPARVRLLGDKKFSITLTEGKKHQIRRMCGALGQSVEELKRVRILNIKLGGLKSGQHRALEGAELERFLRAVGIPTTK